MRTSDPTGITARVLAQAFIHKKTIHYLNNKVRKTIKNIIRNFKDSEKIKWHMS